MALPRRTAAYLPPGFGTTAAGRRQMRQEARNRGWPAPRIYVAGDGPAAGGRDAALEELRAAVTAGRFDALLIPVPAVAGITGPLLDLLGQCTRNGVTVSLVVCSDSSMAAQDPGSAAAPATGPSPVPYGTAGVLARASLDALAGIYPDWRIWLDDTGWHARRRGEGFLQGYRPGAPAYYVRADNAAGLAAQLSWQQAADAHAPEGCQAAGLAPPPWGHNPGTLPRAI